MIPFFHLRLRPVSRTILKLQGFWLTEHQSKHHFKKIPHTHTKTETQFGWQILRPKKRAAGDWDLALSSWRNQRRLSHADENTLKIKGSLLKKVVTKSSRHQTCSALEGRLHGWTGLHDIKQRSARSVQSMFENREELRGQVVIMDLKIFFWKWLNIWMWMWHWHE